MERETKTIETPNGHEVVIKTWITKRERRKIQNVYYENADFSQKVNPEQVRQQKQESGEVEVEDDEMEFELDFGPEVMQKSQDTAMEIIVEEIDGESDDVLESLLNLREEDYDYVAEEIDKVTGESTEEDKKK